MTSYLRVIRQIMTFFLLTKLYHIFTSFCYIIKIEKKKKKANKKLAFLTLGSPV